MQSESRTNPSVGNNFVITTKRDPNRNPDNKMMLAPTTSIVLRCGKSDHKLKGRSRAGDGTSFVLPDLKWMFDCGALMEGWIPRIVFLSHTHSDHCHFLTRITSEDHPPIVYLPAETESYVKAHLFAYKQMTECMDMSEGHTNDSFDFQCILKPTLPGEDIFIRQGGQQFVVRTLKMVHRVPCLGYSIFKIQEKLKKEYEGIPGREIGNLRKAGIEVTQSQEVPFLCFLGDTTDEVFQSHPEILEQHKVIIVECSFIDEGSMERARETTHMHWENLRVYVEAHPDVMFVLTHFSLKYSSLDLREFFCQQQKRYDNIHPMLLDEEIEAGWIRRTKVKVGSSSMPPQCQCRSCKS